MLVQAPRVFIAVCIDEPGAQARARETVQDRLARARRMQDTGVTPLYGKDTVLVTKRYLQISTACMST